MADFIAPSITTSVPSGLLQRSGCDQDNESLLMRQRAFGADREIVPPSVQEVLRSPGQSLGEGEHAFFETRFGHDFSGVRVHADSEAANSARAVNALAYTVGRDIVFETGRYEAGTPDGLFRLAHELAHVVQQDKATAGPQALRLGPADSAAEREAGHTARVVLGGRARIEDEMSGSKLDYALDLLETPFERCVKEAAMWLKRYPSIGFGLPWNRDGWFDGRFWKREFDPPNAKVATARKKFDAAEAASTTAKQDAEDKKKLAAATLLSAAAMAALKTDSQAKKTNFDTALATAQTAAGKFVAADSTAAASFIQAVSDATKVISDYVTAAALDGADVDAEDEKVLRAFEKRDAERTALLKAAPKNPAPGAFDAAVTAQDAWFTAERTQARAKNRTARLQKFVDFVTTNNISLFTPYAKKNWPFKPGEFYAEAYSLWLTDPVYLKTNVKVLFDWFAKGSYL